MSRPSERRRRRSSRTPRGPEYVYDRSAVPSSQDLLLVERGALSACLEAARYAKKRARQSGDHEREAFFEQVLAGLTAGLRREVKPVTVRTSEVKPFEASAFPAVR